MVSASPRCARSRLIAGLAASAIGCGYTSSYVPPDGWRARPLYHGNEIIMVGPTELPRCITVATPTEPTGGPAPPMMGIDDRGYWGPRVFVGYYGPAPLPPHWIFLSHGFVPLPPGPHNLVLGGFSRAFFGGRGSFSSGGGKGAGMVAAFLAAVAVAASAGIAIGLAADRPENSEDAAEGIDAVNQYNDQARTIMAECIDSIERGAAAAVLVEPPIGDGAIERDDDDDDDNDEEDDE